MNEYGMEDDGFGTQADRCSADCGLHVVRPGRIECYADPVDCPLYTEDEAANYMDNAMSELEKLEDPALLRVSEFIEWLETEDLEVVTAVDITDYGTTIYTEVGHSTLLHRFLGIDETKLEAERKGILALQTSKEAF